MPSHQHLSTLAPNSSPLAHRGENGIKNSRPYILSRACSDDIPKRTTTGTYSEWEKTVIDTMALDDDHYYIEYEAYSESDPDKGEGNVDGMEMDMDSGMDADMERIKSKLQRIYITVPRPAVLSSYRPVSLSKKLGAAHIASTTTLDVIMEEDEDTDMDSVHITNNFAMDMVTEEETTMDVVTNEEIPMDTEMVAEKKFSKDTDMDSAQVTTMLPSPHLAQGQAPSSPVSDMTPLEMYHAMKQHLQMQMTPGLTNDCFGTTIPGTGSTVHSNNGYTTMYRNNADLPGSTTLSRGLFPVNRTAKRTRDMFEEDDDQGREMGGSGPPKRMKLANVKMAL